MEEQNLDEMEGSTPKKRDSSQNAIVNIPRTNGFPECQLITAEKCEVLSTKSNTDRLLQKQAFAMNPPLDQRFLGEATKKAIDLAKKATNLDQKQYYEGACKLYENSIDHFLLALKSEPQNEGSRATIRVKCRQYLNRAEELKILIMDKKSNFLKVYPSSKTNIMFDPKQYKVESDSVSDEIIEVRPSEEIKPKVISILTKPIVKHPETSLCIEFKNRVQQEEGNIPTLKKTFTPNFETLAALKNIVPKFDPKKKKKKPKNIVEMPKVKKKDTLRYQGGYCCAVNCHNCEGGDVRFFKVMRKKDQIQSEKWIKAIGKVIDTMYILAPKYIL